jgi:hypothetical protein
LGQFHTSTNKSIVLFLNVPICIVTIHVTAVLSLALRSLRLIGKPCARSARLPAYTAISPFKSGIYCTLQ